jgi:hypothetical protein
VRVHEQDVALWLRPAAAMGSRVLLLLRACGSMHVRQSAGDDATDTVQHDVVPLFSNMRFDVAPMTGRLLVFHNCYDGSRSLHPDSNHAGLPVTAGEK